MATKRIALGKGLGALIPEPVEEEPKSLFYCGIEEIVPDPSQPRKHFEDGKIEELAESIRAKGILEPLIVRKVEQGYELVVGERRWRAAQRAGLKEVPVIVKELDGRERLEISLIENLQREDLNPIEEAEAFKRLIDEFQIGQEELGKRVGKDRTTVANTLRLLRLSPEMRELLVQNRITPGHARAILSLESKDMQKRLCASIIERGLSVRASESLANRLSAKAKQKIAPDGKEDDLISQMTSLQDSLRRHLGTKVLILPSGRNGKRGKIEIEYYSPEDLERIIQAILGKD